jgi:hypothetical protein
VSSFAMSYYFQNLQRVELLFHAFQALFLHFGTGEG